MRIVHVNLSKGFRGGERQTVELARALSNAGIDQVVVCREESPMIAELSSCQCQIHIVKNTLLSAFQPPLAPFYGNTLIHAHETRASQWAYLHNLKTNTPYLITRRIQKRPSTRWFTRKIYMTASSIVSISSSVASTMSSYLTDIGAEQTSSNVIPDTISELPASASANSLRDQFPGKFLIGHVGALSIAEKGQDLIIAAARELEADYPQLKFILIGDGKDHQQLKSRAAGLGNIVFLGFRTDIGNLLAGLDTFIFPSRHEGLGSSLLDALSFDLPIIASDIPGITDIIRDRENGLLVSPADSTGLCSAIKQLYNDSALRARLAGNARESLRNFRPKIVAEQYLGIYRSVVSAQ
ncbi:hypothetical protein AB833_01095 [Chromatiales bacterium (ex Bugula neritina AB1)]|nr:hypothetical protein AB833_01095 [Chromatiales bacterium (ex Bugula neritina AB1)]